MGNVDTETAKRQGNDGGGNPAVNFEWMNPPFGRSSGETYLNTTTSDFGKQSGLTSPELPAASNTKH